MAEFRLQEVANGLLRNAYPFGSHDVELEPLVGEPTPETLARVVDAITSFDRHCRRIVAMVPSDDLRTLARVSAAGFRYVLDVDLRQPETGTEETYSLAVHEPDWVIGSFVNLDEVPDS